MATRLGRILVFPKDLADLLPSWSLAWSREESGTTIPLHARRPWSGFRNAVS